MSVTVVAFIWVVLVVIVGAWAVAMTAIAIDLYKLTKQSRPFRYLK